MARFPHTRLALASDSIQRALEKLGLQASAFAQPNDVEALLNAMILAEFEAHEQL